MRVVQHFPIALGQLGVFLVPSDTCMFVLLSNAGLPVLFTGVRSQTDFEISFSSHPMSQVVRSGVQVTLSCTVQSSLPPLTFRWYHDNSEVTFVQSKFAISNAPQTSTLLINSVSTSDVGQYWCVSEFTDLGSVRSLSAALSLAGAC